MVERIGELVIFPCGHQIHSNVFEAMEYKLQNPNETIATTYPNTNPKKHDLASHKGWHSEPSCLLRPKE